VITYEPHSREFEAREPGGILSTGSSRRVAVTVPAVKVVTNAIKTHNAPTITAGVGAKTKNIKKRAFEAALEELLAREFSHYLD